MHTTLDALTDLRRELTARGWMRKATSRIVLEWLLHLTVALAALWVFATAHSLPVRICAILISTAASMGLATNTHTSSHYATSSRRWVNDLITLLGYPVFVGMSACYWRHKHCVLHHSAPNVIGVDSDIDLSPWFARTWEEVLASTGWRSFYYRRLQVFVFPFTIPLIGFNMQFQSWRWLIGHARVSWDRKYKIDFLGLALHYLVWVAIPLAFFPVAHVAEFYLLRIALMGCALFAVLGPGHLPEEAACLKGSGGQDFVLLQAAATLNFRTGFFGRLICSGLEYQIEHHLFPNVSHVYYPKMAPLVQKFCAEQGVPYRSCSWPAAIWKSLCVFHEPPPIEVNLEARRT